MEFKELEGFSEVVIQLLSDAEYSALQAELLAQPEKGKLIQETGGARKIRVAMQGGEKAVAPG